MGVSPFDKPEMETVAVPIPSLNWPLAWLALTGYSVISSAVGIITDPFTAPFVLAFSLGLYYLALCFYRQRIREREEWRQKKFIEWMRKPLPPAPVTNWNRFEYDVARAVAAEENPQRVRDKGGKFKHPVESHHTRWAKGIITQDDWR